MTQISLEIIKLLKIFTWLIMDNGRLKLFLRVFFVCFQILHGLHSHGGLSYFTPILRTYCFPLSNSSSLLIVSFLLPLQLPLFTINHHYKALQCNRTSMEKLMALMRGQISPYITNNLKLYFRSFPALPQKFLMPGLSHVVPPYCHHVFSLCLLLFLHYFFLLFSSAPSIVRTKFISFSHARKLSLSFFFGLSSCPQYLIFCLKYLSQTFSKQRHSLPESGSTVKKIDFSSAL